VRALGSVLVLGWAGVLAASACASSTTQGTTATQSTAVSAEAAASTAGATTGEQASGTGAAVPTWATTAERLTIPVFRPTRTFGLQLHYANPIFGDPGCEPGREMLRAIYYGRTAGKLLEVLEGHPRYCLDNPIEAPVLRRLTIHGAKATLFDLCKTRGCDPGFLVRALDWCEQGTAITLIGTGIRTDRLVAIARSMRPVDDAPARRCVAPPA
jgi:hypothetical protein